MTEPMEFEVPDAGTPNLGDAGERPDGPDPYTEPSALVPVLGWTADEAAKVVGGMVANVTLALYAFKHKAPPPVAIWPYIAGNPGQEFPLLGAGLAPVLDFVAPKGGAAAVGVSLTAGAGELIGAFARRAPLLNTPPSSSSPSAPAPAAAEPRPAAASNGESAGGFKFKGDALRVLQREEPLSGLGLS